MPEPVISSSLSILADAEGLHSWATGLHASSDRARLLKKFSRFHAAIERLGDNILFISSIREVIDIDSSEPIRLEGRQEIYELLYPIQRSLQEEIVSTAIISTPDRLRRALAADHCDVFFSVRPLERARRPPETGMVPVIFYDDGQYYIGWQMGGMLPDLLGCEYKPAIGRVDFAELIAEEGARLGELHAQVHRTFLRRDRDAKSRLEWERACEAFHSRVSRMDSYIELASRKDRYSEKRLLEFVVCFLEVDPWFFGSGYLKEIFLTRLKRSDLDEATKGRLRRVVLDAVDRRGTREFKYYCRLAAVIGDEDLVSALERASESTDGAVARRAKLMLGTVRQRQGSGGNTPRVPFSKVSL